MTKPKVYVETSVVSYLVSHLSKAPLILGQQQVTKKWWHQVMDQYTPFTSEMVYTKAARGDSVMAEARLSALADIPLLEHDPQITSLASAYLKRIGFPESLRPDA